MKTVVTISQKTSRPLCWNINLDTRYNIWSLYIYPNAYNFFFFYFFFTKYKNDKFVVRWIKANCKDNSENDLIKILSELKPKIILSKKKIKKIKKDFSELRHGFSKSKIKEFKRNQSFYIRNKRDWKNSSWIRKKFF